MGEILDVVAAALPLLVVTAGSVGAGVLVSRSLRDETVLEALRLEVRQIGETHRAVREARSVPPSSTLR